MTDTLKAGRSRWFRGEFLRFGVRELMLLLAACGGLLGAIVFWRQDNSAQRLSQSLLDAAARGDVQTVSQLLAAGISPHAFDDRGNTALWYAVTNDDVAMIDILLEAKVDPNVGNPMSIAVNRNDLPLVRRLLTAGARLDLVHFYALVENGQYKMLVALLPQEFERRNDGTALLRTALLSNHPEEMKSQIVQLLLDRGVEFGLLVEWAMSPTPPDTQLLKAMEPYGVPRTVREAALLNRLDLVKELVAQDHSLVHKRWPLHFEGSFTTLLGIALKRGYREMALYLLETGAPLDEVHRDGSETTALHLAAIGGDAELLKVLVDRGLDVNSRAGSFGTTPLFGAIYSGNVDAVATLLAAGADVNVQTEGQPTTPLHSAMSYGSFPIVELLLASGADKSVANYQGETAQSMAARRGPEFVRLLEQEPAAK